MKHKTRGQYTNPGKNKVMKMNKTIHDMDDMDDMDDACEMEMDAMADVDDACEMEEEINDRPVNKANKPCGYDSCAKEMKDIDEDLCEDIDEEIDEEMDEDMCDRMPDCILLAHSYVPWQIYEKAFTPPEALRKGTLFPELWGVYPIPK